ncbi:MAG: hypothetical protein KC506_00680 [Nanoarchaeota archaeon]|nr:hypothetical protein [Nanoarchaeota archaeon]
MKSKRNQIIIHGLLLILIVLSGYLSYVDSLGSGETVCLTGSDGCDQVQNSKYGSFLGVKVFYWGLAGFTTLLILFIISNSKNKYRQNAKELFILFSLIGAIVAAFFLYTQFFILKSVCSTCLAVDTLTIIVFILGYKNFRK